MDALPVGGDDHQHHQTDRHPDPRCHRDGGQTRHREYEKDLFGGVGTEDMASEANTSSAIRFGNSVCASVSLRNGCPSSTLHRPDDSLGTVAKVKPSRPWR